MAQPPGREHGQRRATARERATLRKFHKKPKTFPLRFRVQLKIITTTGYNTFPLIMYCVTEIKLD